MKLALIPGLLAAGLAISPARADTPLMTAFSDLLGSCWSFVGEGRMDPIYSDTEPVPEFETLCFERMQNHFVRIQRHRSASHGGAFFNEEILHWSAEQKIVSVMFTSSAAGGHVLFRDGLIENGAITFPEVSSEPSDTLAIRDRTPVNGQDPLTLYSNRDGAALPDRRVRWSAVQGDRFSVVMEQNPGTENGGWIPQRERVFIRQDEAVGEELAAQMTGGPIIGMAPELFQPVLGACWSAGFPDPTSDTVDTHCFSDVLGRYVRDRHIIPGNPDYGGETIYFYDRDSDSIDFLYFNSVGGMSDGYDVADWNGISYDREYYLAPDGGVQILGGGLEDISRDGYTSVIEALQGDAWVEISRRRFTRTDLNPFLPSPEQDSE